MGCVVYIYRNKGSLCHEVCYTLTMLEVALERSTGRSVWVHQDLPEGTLYCLDPHCNVPVFARRGDVNRWHFCHYNSGPCGGGGESREHHVTICQSCSDDIR